MLPFIHMCEKKLEPFFMALPRLPEKIAELICRVLPILALLFGILGVIGVWGLWHVGGEGQQFVRIYGVMAESVPRDFFYWAAFLVLALQAAIFISAFGPLNARKKFGWDLLLAGVLLVTLSDIIQMFDAAHGGVVEQFFSTVIWNAIGFYVLFQIRRCYLPKAHKARVHK